MPNYGIVSKKRGKTLRNRFRMEVFFGLGVFSESQKAESGILRVREIESQYTGISVSFNFVAKSRSIYRSKLRLIAHDRHRRPRIKIPPRPGTAVDRIVTFFKLCAYLIRMREHNVCMCWTTADSQELAVLILALAMRVVQSRLASCASLRSCCTSALRNFSAVSQISACC